MALWFKTKTKRFTNPPIKTKIEIRKRLDACQTRRVGVKDNNCDTTEQQY